MTVIPFPQRQSPAVDGWRASELTGLVGGFGPELRSGNVSRWETGTTETGDPQFYLLGPPPVQDCILCVSRLGKLYVVENGAGHVMFENADFELLLRQARASFKAGKARLLAPVVLAWTALRQAVEEKVEPLLVEGEDMLAHFAPQLAAIA